MNIDFSKNYFELFQLPVSFEIDKENLATAYRTLQKTFHPDRFTQASATEKRLSLQYSAFINEAFQTLKNPLKRAIYLLQMANVSMDSEQNTVMDTEFLQEQLELREKVEELNNVHEKELFLQGLEGRIQSTYQIFAQLYQQQSLSQAQQTVAKLQFLEKLYQQAQDLD